MSLSSLDLGFASHLMQISMPQDFMQEFVMYDYLVLSEKILNQMNFLNLYPASEHPFRGIFTSLPKPGGGEFGKFYSLTALNDPRIGMHLNSFSIFKSNSCDGYLVPAFNIESPCCQANISEISAFHSCDADKLPFSIRILLESAIRNCDNFQVSKDDVEKILDWENTAPKQVEIPFKPARVLLQVKSMKCCDEC